MTVNNYANTYEYMMNKMSVETENLKRQIMNCFTVGDEVLGESRHLRGRHLKIFAFDYSHNLIGCSYTGKNDEGKDIQGRCWVNPLYLVKNDGKPVYIPYDKAPSPKRIIVRENAGVTIVLWEDGTKTIVKCSEADVRDPYAAYCAAFAKKCYGTNSKLKKTIEKLTVYQEEK